MSSLIQNIYESHHKENRPQGFSILENKRGLLLKNFIGKNKKVLDIGCRDGVLTKHFTFGNDVTGIDIDSQALLRTSKDLGIRTLAIDLNSDWAEINGEKFDIVVAGEVMEHLYFPEKIVKQIVSHLNSNGMFIGSVPNAFSLKNRLRYLKSSKRYTPLSDPTHINHFSSHELVALLKKYFEKVEIIGLGRYTWFSKIFPSLFAFDLFFVASNPK